MPAMFRRATGSCALLGLAALAALALIAAGAAAPGRGTAAARARLAALGARASVLEGRLATCRAASALTRRARITRRGALRGAARLRPPALRSRVALMTRTVAGLEAARRRCAAGGGPGSRRPRPPPSRAPRRAHGARRAPLPGAPAPAPGRPGRPGDAGRALDAGLGAPTPGAPELEVDADPGGALRFTQTSLTASPGPLTLRLVNAGPGLHTLAVKGNGVSAGPTPNVPGGGSATLSVDLPPGRYTFYCTQPGHEAAGMSGTLTVG